MSTEQQRKGCAELVQKMKDDGTWDLIKHMFWPGPDGPLYMSDLERIWEEEAEQEAQQ